MREFFKPLRRKIGVFTLVMACVLLGFWIRSSSVMDVITVTVASISSAWISLPGGFTFGLFFGKDNMPFSAGTPIDPFGIWTTFSNGSDYAEHPRIPYWLIVITLMLLSTWLLLSKPRQRRTPVEPVPEKVA